MMQCPTSSAVHQSSVKRHARASRPEHSMDTSARTRFWKEVAAGGVSTAIVSAILNPVDVIKTRRQLAPAHVTASMLVRQVVVVHGIPGLWTPGLRATLVREVLYSGCAKGRLGIH
eukprot:3461593-Amphidinium_carterae.1